MLWTVGLRKASLVIRSSALFIWSIIAGFYLAYLLDKDKAIDLSLIRKRLATPITSSEQVVAMRPIKDNWVYDPKTKKAVFTENVDGNQVKGIQAVLRSPIKKDQFLYVLSKVNELQLPTELALIPIIESQYTSDAVSPKGAGGLWQLMPKTAEDMGLSDEERFSLEASTYAALQHFKQLYLKFGNWEFAIAAYNAGSSRVTKALIKNPAAKSINDLNLPAETKNYVNRFLQIKLSQ